MLIFGLCHFFILRRFALYYHTIMICNNDDLQRHLEMQRQKAINQVCFCKISSDYNNKPKKFEFRALKCID